MRLSSCFHTACAGAHTFSLFTFIVVLFFGFLLQVHALPALTSTTTLSDGPTSSSRALTVSTSLSAPLNVASAQAMAPPSDSATLQDIGTIQIRRQSSIIGAILPIKSIPAWLSSLGADGRWPDNEVDYTTGCAARRANWPAQKHWQRILVMAGAWHGGLEGAAQYVKDAALHEAISHAMDYWFGRDIGPDVACLNHGGTSTCPCSNPEDTFWSPNWFANIILIPKFVSQVCLLMNDTLSASQLAHCTTTTGRSYGAFTGEIDGLSAMTGANALDVARIGADQALLTYNVSLITDAYRRAHLELQVRNGVRADGIRPDESFEQHTGVLYNGNYGKDYTNDALNLEIESFNTTFEARPDSQRAFATLFDGDRWMIFRNSITNVLHWDFSVVGRLITFPVIDGEATHNININLTQVRELGKLWSSASLIDFTNSLTPTTPNANAGNLVGNRMFYADDYMVHRGSNYVTSVKMFSSRTKNTECINSQNGKGFHLSDGVLYTYLAGNEYEDIAAAWDWNLLPGITTDYGATALSCGTTEQIGVESFVGGVSDGKTGIAAMSYTNPLTESLSWQKAWFFLDDDVQHIMVSGLSSTTNASVLTVLDQKRRAGPVYLDEEERTSVYEVSGQTLWHDNVGYVFQGLNDSASLSIQVGVKTGNWSDIGTSTQPPNNVDLFAAWIVHEDTSIPLAYTAFPGVNHDDFLQKKTRLQHRTIQNHASVSSVYDDVNKRAMFVFWDVDGGSVTFEPGQTLAPITVTVDGNLAVIYNMRTGEVTISDPSQTLVSAEVSLELGAGQAPPSWGPSRTKNLAFQLPSGGLAGSSVNQTLS
ncbi:polysaccharide lyase family 8 protein [Hebeloma cylindrosporum]|uniref:Polysaccharide lyase family 8 protein n=1 Tax=Hebeloma cylindrosporum TaxID=76867 RepID=A0A0C2YRA8_HEBCY|nr:polysaccharide lyase family 8 protein [Hebeloma cylindrosporum h7]